MDLFRVTAPLTIRLPGGEKHLAVEIFSHPAGLLYFEPFWNVEPSAPKVHVLEGALDGSGPWKIADCIITVTGCCGSDPGLALAYADWRDCLQTADDYPSREQVLAIARRHGASV